MTGKPHFVGEIRAPGQDFVVEGYFVNNFRRPQSVKIEFGPAATEAEAKGTVISGDRFEVWYKMAAMAEIAWNMGWRPNGLVPTVDAVVKQYQIPGTTKTGQNVKMGPPEAPKAKTTRKGTAES